MGNTTSLVNQASPINVMDIVSQRQTQIKIFKKNQTREFQVTCDEHLFVIQTQAFSKKRKKVMYNTLGPICNLKHKPNSSTYSLFAADENKDEVAWLIVSSNGYSFSFKIRFLVLIQLLGKEDSSVGWAKCKGWH